jgi:NitT/TauT family transport system substrate-binding protein
MMSSALAAEKAVYRQAWFGSGLYAPFWLAKEKGLYAAKGLDFEIREGQGGAMAIKLVASGTEAFGDADANVIIKGVQEEAAIQSVFGVLRRNPAAIIGLAKWGIRTPKDLEGKIIAMPPGSSQAQQFPILLKVNGIDPGKVQLLSVPPAQLVPSVLAEKSHALSSYPPTIVPVFEAEKAATTVLNFDDFGLTVAGQAMFANTELMKSKPQVVRGFVEACIEGWKMAMKNPSEATAAYVKNFPMLRAPVVERQLTLFFEYVDSKNTRGKPFGWQSEVDWQETQGLALETGTIRTKGPVERYFTNRFVPGS